MSAHTPEPWAAIKWSCHAKTTVVVDDPTVVTRKRVVAEAGSEEDARLIAAAPELLAVVAELEESSAYWSEYDVPLGIVDRLKSALAKARGGQS
ncbi:hypothetical protein [Pseudoxanthomonas mexicana]